MLRRNKKLDISSDRLEKIKNDLKESGLKDVEPWFEEDLLDRRPHIEALTKVLLETKGNFVMTLSSPWGTGKTTFMRMWKAYLECEKRTCIMFNAWEHDYVENPFLTFIAEIGSQLSEVESSKKKALEKGLGELKRLGKQLFPKLLSIGVRTTLGLSLDFEKLGKDLLGTDKDESNKVGENLAKALGGSMEAYAGEVLKEHTNTKKLVEAFKKQLEAIVQCLDEKPMFFFVDELDRCKPSYSVELLEAVKHLFETSGIIFVLSLDRDQLGHSVRAAYGDGIDADGYLRRFIDLEYRIPEPRIFDFIQELSKEYDLKSFPIFKDCEIGVLGDYLDEFVRVGSSYSLRTIEKAFLRGTVLLRGIKRLENGIFMSRCLPHLIMLRELHADAYYHMLKHKNWPATEKKYFNNASPAGLYGERMVLWGKHKDVWVENDGDIRLDMVTREPTLLGDVNTATLYRTEHGEHLIDTVVKMLDLSESLVPMSHLTNDAVDAAPADEPI